MNDVVQRRRARERVERDPAVRARYDEMLAIARELTREEGDERDVTLAMTDLVFDMQPPQPMKIRDHDPHQMRPPREDGRSDVMWATLSFPLATDDALRRREEVELIYAVRESMAWLRGGITPPELADLGLPNAWDVISAWVDGVRGATYADADLSVLDSIAPTRKRPDGHEVPEDNDG